MRNCIRNYTALILNLLILVGCKPQEQALQESQHAISGVLDAAISSDGRYALISTVDVGAGYWDLEKNALKFQWKQNKQAEQNINVVDISPDGTRAITTDAETFVIWNTTSGKAYGYWQAPAPIRAAAISNKAKYVLLGLADGRVIHIDMTTGRRLEFVGHSEAVASVDLSANGTWAFSGGYDYQAILWNSKTGQVRYRFKHKTRVTQVKLDDIGKQAFSSGTLGNAFVWDLTSGLEKTALQLKEREYVISAARFSHSGEQIVTGAPGRDISLWRVSDGVRLKQWRARVRHKGKPSGAIIYAVGFTENDQYILSESSAGYGEKWSAH